MPVLPSIADIVENGTEYISSVVEEGICDQSQDRTVSSIVESCLFTIFACTWVSIHPNVPADNDGRTVIAFRRLKLMILALLAPEVIILWAIRQRMVASKARTDFKPMTMVQAFFLTMGGFIEFRDSEWVPIPSHHVGSQDTQISTTYLLPHTEREISDKSKGDEITKGLAILQTGWFVVQCIARGVAGLHITELEVVTLAFASLNLITYIIWWNKPLDVRCAIRVEPSQSSSYHAAMTRLKFKPQRSVAPETRKKSFRSVVGDLLPGPVFMLFVGEEEHTGLPKGATRVPSLWAGRLDEKSRGKAGIAAAIAAVAFGAIHFTAWLYPFPSNAERVLWRVASITVAALPLIFVANACLFMYRNKRCARVTAGHRARDAGDTDPPAKQWKKRCCPRRW